MPLSEILRQCRLTFFATAGLALAAGAQAQAPGVRDSNGVAVVEHRDAGGLGRVSLQLDDRPLIQIGSESGGPEHQFSGITGLARLSTGSIAVADRSSGEIRVFDRSGTFVRRVGRKGQGPGEFRTLAHIRVIAADSLIAIDGVGGRITVFDPEGRPARTLVAGGAQAPANPGRRAPSMTVLPGSFADGAFLAHRRASVPGTEQPDVVRDTLIVSVLRADGSVLGEIGRFPGPEVARSRVVTPTGPNGAASVSVRTQSVVFGRETFLAIGPDVMFAGDGTSYEVRTYDRLGKLRRILRVAQPTRAVTREMIVGFYAAAADAAGRPRPGADVIFGPEAAPAASTLPAFAALRVDAANRLWIKDYPVPGDRVSRWQMFDSTGTRVGAFTCPVEFEPIDIGTDTVAGVWRDDVGVESVRVYRFALR